MGIQTEQKRTVRIRGHTPGESWGRTYELMVLTRTKGSSDITIDARYPAPAKDIIAALKKLEKW